MPRRKAIHDDPQWYRDAIVYELHVRAFADADGDGVGDFRGLTGKLDYLEDLGVTAIWLLPFYPSPLRDDGYDIADGRSVHEMYGSLRDFESFLDAAHQRGIRVITELVLNHTSDQHPWFQRARRAEKGTKDRDYYVWTDSPEERYSDARIIFRDFEHSNWAYDNVAKSYYWHRFYSHQPDLNFESPAVREEMLSLLDYWFAKGVDGMRLDAIPYLFERDGTDCENLAETHAFLKQLRKHVDDNFPHRMLLAEANQWPEDAAAYFGDGDECHMNFHFPLMPRLFMALQMEDRFPIIDILQETPAIPETAQWALFLRNHDELTLEMVTDEERDYMYRVYAADKRARVNLGIRRRLAPLLQNDRRSIELMNGLLLSLPGTPVLYYGDELGMGDNVYLGDRNGVRTPMQWSSDRNAGFSRASPQSLYLPLIIEPEYHYESLNVEAQLANPTSLLWWTRRLIALRKRFLAFGRGTIEFLTPSNRKVLVYLRQHGDELILVAANLSRFPQAVAVDLSRFAGLAPLELFGRTEFPVIGEQPYLLTLGPKSFYWFSLQRPEAGTVTLRRELASLQVDGPWTALLDDDANDLAGLLPAYLAEQRWFGGKAHTIERVEVSDVLAVPRHEGVIALLDVAYKETQAETYQLPLLFVTGARAHEIEHERAHAIVARLTVQHDGVVHEGLLVDAAWDPSFGEALVDAIGRGQRLEGRRGNADGTPTRAFGSVWESDDEAKRPAAIVGTAEQSNTSIVFRDRAILKLYRRVREGKNPDVELGCWLTEHAQFEHTPPVAGWITYAAGRGDPRNLGVLHGFVRNEGDAWLLTTDAVEDFLEERIAMPVTAAVGVPPGVDPFALARAPLPAVALELVGSYADAARVLGVRTAQMHHALALAEDDPAFKAEPFTPFYRRSLYQSMRNLTVKTFEVLSASLPRLGTDARQSAAVVLGKQQEIVGRFRETMDGAIAATRIRTHGDFHLGQVLNTGRDFVIIDFEGEPGRSIEERRIKRSPLRDVSSMVRSFHYAAHAVLRGRLAERLGQAQTRADANAWAQTWYRIVAARFVASYLEHARSEPFLARATDDEIAALLRMFALEKAIYELHYELLNRPDWVAIPLVGILEQLEDPA